MLTKPMNGWRPLVEREASKQPAPDPDPRDTPIEFVLTPRERDMAVIATLELEQRRRRINREDDARALAVLLEQPRDPE